MATTFKTLTNNDVASTRTLLHEAIPITGTIASGTYNVPSAYDSEGNIRNYSHGMFQSVYDYPYLSSSANQIFDITVGYNTDSGLSGTTPGVQQAKKINIYNQMAQVLVGYDATGSILKFDKDGDIASGGTKINEAIFINFARLLTKDEVKKGSFELKVLTGSYVGNPGFLLTVSDYQGTTNYRTNSPAGEYGMLYTSSATPDAGSGVGLIYYQAGVAVLTASIFSNNPIGAPLGADDHVTQRTGITRMCEFGTPLVKELVEHATASIDNVMSASAISSSADGFRNRLYNLQFNNTTELNSTIYFCRSNHNDFNYSSNPTYLSSRKLVVKDQSTDSPVSYITTVGLYSADNELLAVAKLSEPIKKTPETELTLRVRLDY